MLKKFCRKIAYNIFSTMSFICNMIFPMKENKICFLSDVRSKLGGNLECVYNYMKGKDFILVTELKGDRRIHRGIKDTLILIYNLSTSHYILLDDISAAITLMKVRKNQEIIQLWHGPGAFKRFGWSRILNGENIKSIHKGYSKYTKAIVSGEGIKNCYSEAYRINVENIKATGFPRTDIFFDEEYILSVKKKFYEKYPGFINKKIILFAPTYRNTNVHDASYDFSTLDFEKLYYAFKDEYVFILKWHPALYNNIIRGLVETPDFLKYPDFYYDFSSYRDINDLLIICDVLVTDYSSVIFDYLLVNKPIVYYTYDLEEYTGYGGRGLYFDFDEYVYGEIATDQEQLVEAIYKETYMPDKRKKFYDKFMSACDGHSTQKTCEWIFNIRDY